MDDLEIVKFCNLWLPLWTGNRPDELINCYHENAFYRDPARPDGLNGHSEILPYFQQLLQLNPNWKWAAEEIFPTSKGFILKWKAEIPAWKVMIIESGMDILEVENNKIIRNEVYFDRTNFLNAISGK